MKLLRDMEDVIQHHQLVTSVFALSTTNEELDSTSESSDDNQLEDLVEVEGSLCSTYATIHKCRYAFRARKYRKRNVHSRCPKWKKIVDGRVMTDEEFLNHFRVTRLLFHKLALLIKDHPSVSNFGGTHKSRMHFTAELPLLVTLRYFGSEGNAASAYKVKLGLGISKGSVLNFISRTVTALLSLEEKCLFWPLSDERKEISRRIMTNYDFPFCVGFIDGTHLGLAFKPEKDPEEYWTRKQAYAINVMVFVDDQKRICHLTIGWPGSVHDNRIWKNSVIHSQKEAYFMNGEYLLGDSAFNNSNIMVSSYKRAAGTSTLPPGQKWFNDKLSTPRSKVENTIGIWKGRFPYLRNIRVKLRGVSSMRKIIRYVKASAILHNLLVKHHISEAWIIHEADDIDETGLPEVDNDGDGVDENGARRRQIHNFLDNYCN